MMNISRFAFIVGVGTIAIGCSSDPASGDATGGACAELAAAQRAYATKCGDSKSEAGWQHIVARAKFMCESSLSLPGVAIKEEHLSACAKVLNAAPCATNGGDSPRCDMPSGTLADGAACSTGQQCKSGGCSGESGDPLCGTCAARVPIGGDCSTNPICVEDATCVPATKTCKAFVYNGVGASCDSLQAERCQSGLYCDFATKSCVARAAVGAACTSTAFCQIGLLCSETSRTCVAPPARATEGQACAGSVQCDTNLTCDRATMKCVKILWVAPGGDCSAEAARCDHGVCNETTKRCPALIPDGQPCTYDPSEGVCEKFAGCVDGTCRARETTVCK